MGSKILGLFEASLKFVIVMAILLLLLRLWPTGAGAGGNALGEALSGIGGAIGQLDDLIRDIRAASGV